MSSTLMTPRTDTVFEMYLMSEDDGEESEAAEENSSEQTSSWTYTPYTPKRASYHTVRGKIKRYFA